MSGDDPFGGNPFGENVAALFLLYARPVAAISRILDRGRLWFAIAAALATSILAANAPVLTSDGSQRLVSHGMFQYVAPLLEVAVLAAAVVLIHAIRGFGSFRVLMARDYAPLLM